jgi:hypothetical protein
MYIEENAGARTDAAYVKRPAARALAVAALVAAASLGATQLAAADEPQRKGWWFDGGIGATSVSVGSDPIASGGGGMWVDVVVGGRLNNHWLMGLSLGGSALKPGSGSYYNNSNANCGCGDIWGEGITHSMLAVRYVPRIDHGWVYGLSTGPSFYDNNSVGRITGNYNTGSGWETGGVVGYDWLLSGAKTHIEAVLNVEQGHISYAAPLTGQFNYTEIAASVHVAWF